MKGKEALKKILGENTVVKIREFKKQFSKVYREELYKRQVFYHQFVKKNDLCFDVGANVGNRIIPLLKIGARVVAIEPQKVCYEYLKFRFGNRIILITKGLGAEVGTKQFHISNLSITSSFSDEWISAVKNGRFKNSQWDKTVDVEMTTLDNLISKHGVPAFIKIDVEGYELEVLRGLTKPIKMISFEYTVPEQTHKITDCIKRVETFTPGVLCNYSIGEDMK